MFPLTSRIGRSHAPWRPVGSRPRETAREVIRPQRGGNVDLSAAARGGVLRDGGAGVPPPEEVALPELSLKHAYELCRDRGVWRKSNILGMGKFLGRVESAFRPRK